MKRNRILLLLGATGALTTIVLTAAAQTPPPSTTAGQAGGDLSGIVVDSAQEAPLPGVTIYLNGTSKGAISGDDGHFAIHNIRPGKYDLVVSSIGYETLVYPISADNLPPRVKFI